MDTSKIVVTDICMYVCVCVCIYIYKFAYLKKFGFITDSDAHFINNVGDVYNVIYMEHRSFKEFAMALKGEEGRWIDTMAFRNR